MTLWESSVSQGMACCLQFIPLWKFSNLEMDWEALLHLTSLQQLTIEDCPKLEKMAVERLVAHVIKIFIYGCYLIWDKRESLGATVELLPCDLEVTRSSLGNSLLQKYRIRLRRIDPKMVRPCLDPTHSVTFVHWAPFIWFEIKNCSMWAMWKLRRD